MVGLQQALTSSPIGGSGGRNSGPPGACVPVDDQDTVCDRRDEDCDGRIDEDCDFGPSKCPRDSRVIQGTAGDDVLVGTWGRDCILGYGGNDWIRGASGDDVLIGGPGDDFIQTGSGRDLVRGGRGDDEIDASDSWGAELYGDDGDDVLVGSFGRDEMHGGAGNDRLEGRGGGDELYGDGCNDRIDGGAWIDRGIGGDGYDLCTSAWPFGCERTRGEHCTRDSQCAKNWHCASNVEFCVPRTADSCGSGSGSCVARSATDSTCDGIDDDCDGRIDDDFVATPSSCGTGGCAATGSITCANGHLTDSCRPGTPASNDASCDGADDDCDTRTDEDYLATAVHCGVGACAATGTSSCVSGNVVVSCEPGTPAPADATCNGIDDDCSGAADEDFVSTASSCGVGACAATGSVSCVYGAPWDSCTPGTPATDDASCNGIDDDCDGRTDEDFAPVPSSCGVGACRAAGLVVCVQGAEVLACTPGTPAAGDASCDAIDDDCDGNADEDFAPQSISCGTGVCRSTGTTACISGTVVQQCTAGTPSGADTTCDGVDDDCDGAADEHYVGHSTACGVGACAATGFSTCEDGSVHDNCAPGGPSSDGNCDAVDNDCDGAVDEHYVGQPTACGVGACAATGFSTCEAGSVHDNCTAGSPSSDSSCDGVDQDCDGNADEHYVGQSTACGVGACAATGTSSCEAGSVHDNCTPGSPSSDANCDGVDQDCDGNADDEYVASCSGTVSVTCQNGQVQSNDCDDNDVCTGEETCNLGACVPGTPIATEDGNACTTDTCDPETGAITHVDMMVGASCSDGLACNGVEVCGHPCTPVPSDAIAHWPAEGDGHDTIDSHDATLNNGVAFTAGIAGQAFRFDGTNDYARATVPLQGRSAATLEAWFRTTPRTVDRYIVSVPFRSAAGNNGLDILIDTQSRVVNCAFPTGTGRCGTYTVSTATNGQWHHVVSTFANNTLSLYFDGQLKGSVTVTGTLRTDADELNIGRFGAFGRYFNGDIDEVRVYSRGLTAAEVASRFAARGSLCLLTCLPGTPEGEGCP